MILHNLCVKLLKALALFSIWYNYGFTEIYALLLFNYWCNLCFKDNLEFGII